MASFKEELKASVCWLLENIQEANSRANSAIVALFPFFQIVLTFRGSNSFYRLASTKNLFYIFYLQGKNTKIA